LERTTLAQRLDNEILILDGAMGTMLQPHLASSACMDLASVEKPDLVGGVYNAYAEAGADLISTNTFGANRIKLSSFGLHDMAVEINARAAALARKYVPETVLVAGCIGPTGELAEPMGPMDFASCYQVFLEQAAALAEGGADLFLLETFSDLKELKIACMAVRESTGLPIMASMTYEEGFTTFTGTDPVTAAVVLESLDVDVLGVNCSTGPEPMLEIVGRYAALGDTPVFVEPNAGLPRLDGGRIAYDVGPEEMAGFAAQFVEIGANIVGSCCGSTPVFTEALRKRIKAKKPLSRGATSSLRITSRTNTVTVGDGNPFCIIGERINPTNRDDLSGEIEKGSCALLQREATLQQKQGAHCLDLNVGLPSIDEAHFMGKAVTAVETVAGTPLSIDSIHAGAVEAGLKAAAGKVLINSVNAESKSLEKIIPLVKKYGAALLCLPVGEKGVPKTAESRVALLREIIDYALKAGMKRKDLICDCLTLTVSAEQKRADETLKALQIVRNELHLPTVLGVSNISFGLPERSLINSTFLSMAMASGLDAAIMNPGDARMMETVQAASVLTVRDRDSKEFVRRFARKKKKAAADEQLYLGDEWKIPEAVLNGNREEIASLVDQALASGKSALDINKYFLIPAIQEVGKRYDRKEIYLPQMILAAETMQEAFRVLEPHFGSEGGRAQGKVLLCTVKGDVHDIGKNIVGLFLKNHGFEVTDLGKDVSAEQIVAEAGKCGADIVGLSALMTTTMVEMDHVVKSLRLSQSKAKIIVGGAVVTKRYAREIGADGFARDGVSAVELVNELLSAKPA